MNTWLLFFKIWFIHCSFENKCHSSIWKKIPNLLYFDAILFNSIMQSNGYCSHMVEKNVVWLISSHVIVNNVMFLYYNVKKKKKNQDGHISVNYRIPICIWFPHSVFYWVSVTNNPKLKYKPYSRTCVYTGVVTCIQKLLILFNIYCVRN